MFVTGAVTVAPVGRTRGCDMPTAVAIGDMRRRYLIGDSHESGEQWAGRRLDDRASGAYVRGFEFLSECARFSRVGNRRGRRALVLDQRVQGILIQGTVGSELMKVIGRRCDRVEIVCDAAVRRTHMGIVGGSLCGDESVGIAEPRPCFG